MAKLTGEERAEFHNRGQKDASEGHSLFPPRSPDAFYALFDPERNEEAWDAYHAGVNNAKKE